jgi:GT2 family glycosyltransferase
MVVELDGRLSVSVVVPVRGDTQGCRQVVSSLSRQTLARDRFDIIIGADGVAPGSLDDLATEDGRIRVVHGPPETSYAARNRAAASSDRDALAFCDSDCRPDPDWLAAGLAALGDADVVAGEVAFVGPSRPSIWTLLTIDTFLDQRRNVQRSRAVTANLFVRRRAFEAWGPFDPVLASGGDFEFVARAVSAGARLAYAPGAIVRHPTLDDARTFFGKVWRTNRWSAIRRRRSGSALTTSAVVSCVPVAGAVVARRQSLRPLGALDRARIASAGIDLSRPREIAALAAYYLLVSQAANAARLSGWLTGMPPAPPSGRQGAQPPRPGSSASAP